MTNEQKAVQEFHKKFETTVNVIPTLVGIKLDNLRIDLIEEELAELYTAQNNEDIVEIADALGDLLYVVYGAAVTYGIDLEPIFNEIHRSNLSKMWADGLHKREDGKILKPPTYSPPKLLPILVEQGFEKYEKA